LPATVRTNEFFCVSCRLTAGLDIHGRCATCGSDAVTHPLRYRLIISAPENCGVFFGNTNLDFNQRGKV